MLTHHLHRQDAYMNEYALCGQRVFMKPSEIEDAHIAWWSPNMFVASRTNAILCKECMVLLALREA